MIKLSNKNYILERVSFGHIITTASKSTRVHLYYRSDDNQFLTIIQMQRIMWKIQLRDTWSQNWWKYSKNKYSFCFNSRPFGHNMFYVLRYIWPFGGLSLSLICFLLYNLSFYLSWWKISSICLYMFICIHSK